MKVEMRCWDYILESTGGLSASLVVSITTPLYSREFDKARTLGLCRERMIVLAYLS